jgi:ubiquinone/menaquinone biosynthesis C-methylase UbiE
MSSIPYHLRELSIQESSLLPITLNPGAKVLDVGCGIGQMLMQLPSSMARFGVDLDASAIEYGRKQFPQLQLAVAAGEALPFCNEQFDVVLCRVALPYMDIPKALQEFHRVCRPRAALWLTLHSWRMAWERIKTRGWKDRIYQTYALLNGLLLHYCGVVIRFPLQSSRIESIQTEIGIQRALQRAGFNDIRMDRSRRFEVIARKS